MHIFWSYPYYFWIKSYSSDHNLHYFRTKSYFSNLNPTFLIIFHIISDLNPTYLFVIHTIFDLNPTFLIIIYTIFEQNPTFLINIPLFLIMILHIFWSNFHIFSDQNPTFLIKILPFWSNSPKVNGIWSECKFMFKCCQFWSYSHISGHISTFPIIIRLRISDLNLLQNSYQNPWFHYLSYSGYVSLSVSVWGPFSGTLME